MCVKTECMLSDCSLTNQQEASTILMPCGFTTSVLKRSSRSHSSVSPRISFLFGGLHERLGLIFVLAVDASKIFVLFSKTHSLPPSDQLLSAALAGSLFALQLSKREGFEVKVSEALHKAKPVVVSNAGGIPHQVIHGKNGFIVPFGDIEMTAMRMEQLVTDEKLLGKMREYAAGCVNEEFFTQFVAVNWLYMARGLVDGTLVGRVEVAFQEAQEEQVSERPTPEWKATGFSDGPADSVRAIDGVVFDYDHIETEEEYRARRTAMAGPSPWIYKLWQAEMLGEDRRDQARCLQTEGVASFCREDFKQGKMLAPGEIVGGQAEMERGRSWDLESEKSEISEWGTLDDEEATGELGLDAPTD